MSSEHKSQFFGDTLYLDWLINDTAGPGKLFISIFLQPEGQFSSQETKYVWQRTFFNGVQSLSF